VVPLGEVGGTLLLVRSAAVPEAAAAVDDDAAESLRYAFVHAPIGVAVAAPDGRWLQVNAALCALVGRDRDDLLTTDLQSLTHPDDLAHDLELIGQVVQGEAATCQLETRYVAATGAGCTSSSRSRWCPTRRGSRGTSSCRCRT
jgi:PAS domain S-box-containing protein